MTAGLDGVFSNGDLVQLMQLPARLCLPGAALVLLMRLARLVALQEGRLGHWTLDEQRERGLRASLWQLTRRQVAVVLGRKHRWNEMLFHDVARLCQKACSKGPTHTVYEFRS